MIHCSNDNLKVYGVVQFVRHSYICREVYCKFERLGRTNWIDSPYDFRSVTETMKRE